MKRFLAFLICMTVVLPLKTAYCEGGHHEESPSGASFKPGKGILMTAETRKNLDVSVAEVTEEKLQIVIPFNVQIFGEEHRFALSDADHSDCKLLGSGLLPPDRAAPVEPKQPVKLLTAANEILDGFVVAVKRGIVFGETEIVVGVTSAGALKDGDFASATITIPRKEPVTVIPRSALLQSSQGTFVYVVNGDAYLRTAVIAGNEANGKIEIIDGLFTGDEVVTRPVEALWLIELRATKGGGHSH